MVQLYIKKLSFFIILLVLPKIYMEYGKSKYLLNPWSNLHSSDKITFDSDGNVVIVNTDSKSFVSFKQYSKYFKDPTSFRDLMKVSDIFTSLDEDTVLENVLKGHRLKIYTKCDEHICRYLNCAYLTKYCTLCESRNIKDAKPTCKKVATDFLFLSHKGGTVQEKVLFNRKIWKPNTKWKRTSYT